MSFALRGIRKLASAAQIRMYSSEMKFTFAAANQVFYDSVDINQVDVPTFSGAFGILPKHVPTLGKIVYI